MPLLIEDMYDFLLYEKGKSVLVNGISMKALILDTTEKINKDEEKIVYIKYNMKSGDIVEYNDHKWLSICDDNNGVYTKNLIQRCNASIKVVKNAAIYNVNCIVTDKVVMSVDSNKYLSTVDNNYYLMVKKDDITNLISLNDIFTIGKYNYKVESIDDISKVGILILKVNFTESVQHIPVYTIEILNGTSLSLNMGNTALLNVKVKQDDTVLTTNPSLTFTSSNASIVTVDSVGNITPVSVGNATLTVALQSDANVKDTIDITVAEAPVIETYYFGLTGDISLDSEIKTNQTKVYTCTKKNSKGEVVTGSFNFTYDSGGATTDKFVFTILNSNQCSIKYLGKTVFYTVLKATDKQDSTLFVEKNIKLRSSM